MKPSQRLIYAERIDRVLRHLEKRLLLDDVPSLSELAGVAALSEHHFHRVFRLMTGETVSEAVRRLRLASALPTLAAEATITRAAADSGYATPQSFARALKRETGATPTAARASPDRLTMLNALLRSPASARAALAIELVSVEPFRLLAIRNVGDYAELNHGYTRLFELVLEQVPPEALRGIHGVPRDDPRHTPAGACRFDCALAVGDAGVAGGDLFELRLGGGTHARLRHLGDYDELPASIDRLYAQALATLGRELADGPPFIHYLDDPEEVAEADLRSDIYLPLLPDEG